MANVNDSHLSRNSTPSYYQQQQQQGNADSRFLSQQQQSTKQQRQQILTSSLSSSSMDHRMTTSAYNNTQLGSLDGLSGPSYSRQDPSNQHHHSLEPEQHRYNQQQQVLSSQDQEYTQQQQQQHQQQQVHRDSSTDNGVCFMDFSSTSTQAAAVAAAAAANNNFIEPDLNSLVPLHDAASTVITQKQPLKTRSNMNLNIANMAPGAHNNNCCSDRTNSADSNAPNALLINNNNNNPYPANFNDQQQLQHSSRHPLIFQPDHQHLQYAQQQASTTATTTGPHNQQVIHQLGQIQYNQQHAPMSSHNHLNQQQQQQHHLHHQYTPQHLQHHHQHHTINHQPLLQQQATTPQHQLFSQSPRDLDLLAGGGVSGSIKGHKQQHHYSTARQQLLSSPNHAPTPPQYQQQHLQSTQHHHPHNNQHLAHQQQHQMRYNQQSSRYTGGNISDSPVKMVDSCGYHQARDRGESWLSNFPIGANTKQYGLSGKLRPIELMKNEIYDQLNNLLNIVYSYESLVLQSNCKQEEVACSMTNAGALQKTLRQNQERFKLGEISLELLEHSKRELEQEQNLFRLAVSEVNEFRKQLLKSHYQIFRELSEIKEKVFAQLNHWIQEQQQGSTNAVYHSAVQSSSSATSGLQQPGTPNCHPSAAGAASSIVKLSSTSMTTQSTTTTGIGAQPTNSDYQTYALDLIENQIHLIVDVVNETKAQLGRGAQKWSEEKWIRCDEGIIEVGSNLLQKYDRFLEDVIVKSFIVEKQPPQVMKTNTRFSSTCRLLCGNRINILAVNPPQVKVTIISENTAKSLMQRRNELLKTSWSSMAQQPELDDTELHRLFNTNSSASTSPGPAYSPSSVPQNLSSPRSNASSTQPVDQLNQPGARSAQQQAQQHSYGGSVPMGGGAGAVNYHNHLNDISSNRNLKVIDISRYENCGEIINNTNLMESNESTRHVTCNFRNMQLKKIKRTEKKGTESVMDEKSILLFSAEFRMPLSANMDNYYQIMAFSLPVVVIVHGNQESHAWATVTWHNAFAKSTEYLYNVPDKVQWYELGQVLSEKFNSCTGRGLNGKNLDFLASKICRTAQINNSTNTSRNLEVNWAQFAKELLPDRSFTFWEWFYSMFKLTREHLRELWADDRIYGFIGKGGCIKLLSEESMNMGTFLLRFSEHELGGVTIAYVSSGDSTNQHHQLTSTGGSNNHKNSATSNSMDIQQTSQSPTYGVTPEGNHICFVHPFVHKDLNTRSLADRIRDLRDLLYLYPDIPKGEAFKKYYTPIYDVVETPEGYIKPMLVQVLMKDYPTNENSNAVGSFDSQSGALKRRDIGDNGSVGPATPSSPGNVQQHSTANNNNHNDNFTTEMDYNDEDDNEDELS